MKTKSSAAAEPAPPSSGKKKTLPGPSVFEWFPASEDTIPSIVAATVPAALASVAGQAGAQRRIW